MQSERTPLGIRAVYNLQTLADSVAPADVARHLDVLRSIRGAIDQDVAVTPRSPAEAKAKKDASSSHEDAVDVALVGIGLFLVIAGAVFVVRRSVAAGRRWRWRRSVDPDSGQVPGKAIRARSRSEAERRVVERRCTCGRPVPAGSSVTWSTMTFDGRSVSAGRASCPSCGEGRVRYFEIDDS